MQNREEQLDRIWNVAERIEEDKPREATELRSAVADLIVLEQRKTARRSGMSTVGDIQDEIEDWINSGGR